MFMYIQQSANFTQRIVTKTIDQRRNLSFINRCRTTLWDGWPSG